MCARYTLRAKLNLILAQFAAEVQEGIFWEPRYNIGIWEKKPAVLAMRLVDGKRQLSRFYWPLVPSWSKTWKVQYSTFNARAETVDTQNTYRSAYKHRRCLVIADGWREWEPERVDGEKLPWHYEVDGGKPFAIAGLWETWQGESDSRESCTLITTDGNDFTKRIGHPRMPVIVDEPDYDAWLSGEQIPLVAFPADRLSERAVSTFGNKPGKEGPECLAPRSTK